MSSPATAPTQAAPTQDERSMAMLAHVLMIFTGFLGPLIIWLIRKQSKFVSFHALQALAFQVAYALLIVVLVIAAIVFTVAGAAAQGSHGGGAPPVLGMLLFGLVWLVAMGGGLACLILGILYGIKANNGEWAAYPLIGNWVRQKMGV
ncbi:MAG TPA: DUF4870 domain-containing protein [Terriglobales bacterium]|nr:DUF4870 domain-containing protein [Terriglobales bacterium]